VVLQSGAHVFVIFNVACGERGSLVACVSGRRRHDGKKSNLPVASVESGDTNRPAGPSDAGTTAAAALRRTVPKFRDFSKEGLSSQNKLTGKPENESV
jgi:hypothetical protein